MTVDVADLTSALFLILKSLRNKYNNFDLFIVFTLCQSAAEARHVKQKRRFEYLLNRYRIRTSAAVAADSRSYCLIEPSATFVFKAK